MKDLIFAALVVFVIGMFVRFLIKKSKSRKQLSPSSQSSTAAPSAASNFCPQCGTAITPGSGFCTNCGAKLQ